MESPGHQSAFRSESVLKSQSILKLQGAQAAVDFIEEHLDGGLSLEKTAEALHYSKYHLHRTFAEAAGMTLHAYAVRRRLTEAARLLVESERPVLDIALSCGYESQQAFTDAFRAMYKQPPARYRVRGKFYPLQYRLLLYDPAACGKMSLQKVRPVREEEIPVCLNLARQSVDGYPCMDEGEYLCWLRESISNGQVLLAEGGEKALAVLGFSWKTGEIDFLGLHPRYRRSGAVRLLMGELRKKYLPGRQLSITTYRERDRADTGWRVGLKKLGFVEGELLTEFGYPTQRLYLPKG